jgi:hypothetical protein
MKYEFKKEKNSETLTVSVDTGTVFHPTPNSKRQAVKVENIIELHGLGRVYVLFDRLGTVENLF